MKNELTFKRNRFDRHLFSLGWTHLCRTALRTAVHLPADCIEFTVVFSKKDMPESFRIEKRHPRGMSYDRYGVDQNFTFMCDARQEIERQYKQGMRYIRIEY